MNKKPLFNYKFEVIFKSVLIQVLDADKNIIKNANASGFIVQEEEALFLYTCWHVATGYNMHDLKVGFKLPERVFLKLNLQNVRQEQEGVTVIGDNQSIIVPLYDQINTPRNPLWYQDKKDAPNEDLNAINLKVPFWHDAIKIPLPNDLNLFEGQIITNDYLSQNLLSIGDKALIVGYPYGYSAVGFEQPTPIVITRFIAASRMKDRLTEVLLDGPCAPGMSGSPVFAERNNRFYLVGMYTGSVYPDYDIEQNEKTTALGTFCDMNLLWKAIPLIRA